MKDKVYTVNKLYSVYKHHLAWVRPLMVMWSMLQARTW